jgi:PAB-dependent poly(A)-specific ribonuclease subunit 2
MSYSFSSASTLIKSKKDMPRDGDSLAFDAEFVQVENESSVLTATGSKVVIREGRYAVGRISLLDCESGRELVDDRVIPREPVVDFLTRFSGITQSDLNPKTSRHHLISARSAYLKMRYLVDRYVCFESTSGHVLQHHHSYILLIRFWTLHARTIQRL